MNQASQPLTNSVSASELFVSNKDVDSSIKVLDLSISAQLVLLGPVNLKVTKWLLDVPSEILLAKFLGLAVGESSRGPVANDREGPRELGVTSEKLGLLGLWSGLTPELVDTLVVHPGVQDGNMVSGSSAEDEEGLNGRAIAAVKVLVSDRWAGTNRMAHVETG